MSLTNFPNGVKSDYDFALSTVFASASTAQTGYLALPVDCTLVYTGVTVTTSARVAAYTVGIGSAGTALVDGVANTTGVAGSVSSLTLEASPNIDAGESIRVARGVQGSTGETQVTMFFKRRD